MKKLKYAYYPGCIASYSGKELGTSTLKLAEKIGIELIDIPEYSCCGGGVVDEANENLNTALNARNLALTEQKGLEMMTICSTCQGMMTRSNRLLKEDEMVVEKVKQVLSKIGMKYGGTVNVKHILQILIQDYGLENLKKVVERPLTGLKVGAFYGCHLLRPGNILGFDNPVNPSSFESLIAALGATPIYYDGRIKCCGFPILFVKEDSANKMAGIYLMQAKEKGADCLVTSCPLCHISLDTFQSQAEKVMKAKIDLPIFHLSQLVGLALGFQPKDLGMSRHLISPFNVLEDIGIRV